jgi:hypothetical protein
MQWKLSTLRDGSSPHYAVEALHTMQWKLSTLRGGSSPHYAMEALHMTRRVRPPARPLSGKKPYALSRYNNL